LVPGWFRGEELLQPAHERIPLAPYGEVGPILAAADHPTEWEAPPDFDWEMEMAGVRALKPELERLLGIELAMDQFVQDASFLTELSTPTWNIRFSRFGRLFTLWRQKGAASASLLDCERVIAHLQAQHRVYVDVRHLLQPYKGAQEQGARLNWWDRFFDYS
jgi:hypothetical protein